MGIFKKNNQWWIDYCVNGSRFRKPISKSKSEAEKVLTKIKSEILHKRYAIPEDRKIKFVDFAMKFIENHSLLAKSTLKSYISILKNLVGYLGNFYLDEISVIHCEQYKKTRLKQKSLGGRPAIPGSINQELSVLRTILNKAVAWDYLSFNPVKKFGFFKVEQKERILSQKEIKKLVATAKPPFKNAILVALNTGMRRSEIFNLEWNQVNLEEGFITVEKTKTRKIRRIPLNPTLIRLFTRMFSENGTNKYVFINSKNGKHYNFVFYRWKKLLKKAGIRDIRFHDLRHCFATYALMNGGDIISLKETLGHADITTTSRYTKAMLEGQRRLVTLFEVEDDQEKSDESHKKRSDL